MSFADKYLSDRTFDRTPYLVSEFTDDLSRPLPDLYQAVVIPCYDEPSLLPVLRSLAACHPPARPVEIILVINAPLNASVDVARRNQQAYKEGVEWLQTSMPVWMHCRLLHLGDLPVKEAGPGLARKIGMDVAVEEFNALKRPDGIISSLDADVLVAPNYLSEVQRLFLEDPALKGCSVYFEHPLSEEDPQVPDRYGQAVYRAITQYELHLRYYVEALRFAGYPYAFHTVGSCFSVRAGTYTMQGGMNKRQGGEDFYFLQKVIPLGNFAELNSTCVYPSARPSDRVPFGTGPFIRKFIEEGQQDWHTYDFEAFRELKALLELTDSFYRAGESEITGLLGCLPEAIRSFLAGEAHGKIPEINAHSASMETFRKRFFNWFNMFQVLKFLNYAHEDFFARVPAAEAAVKLPVLAGHPSHDAQSLLKQLREIQQRS